MQKRSTSINVVAKAAQVLKACQALGGGLSLADIARHVGLPRSTVQRIVQTLVQEGFLASDGSARSISLGPQLLAMGAGAASDVVERLHPLLKQIAAKTGETVDLARFNRDHMVFINQVPGPHRLQAVSAVGDVFPLHCTANGKAALALLPEHEAALLLNRRFAALTPNTKTQRVKLEEDIAVVRTTGIARDAEEHTLGISALGCAMRDRAQQIYAISIPVPTVRFAQKRDLCERTLKEAHPLLTEFLQTA
jgi:DNA-binding IclR family transcriptional regulator